MYVNQVQILEYGNLYPWHNYKQYLTILIPIEPIYNLHDDPTCGGAVDLEDSVAFVERRRSVDVFDDRSTVVIGTEDEAGPPRVEIHRHESVDNTRIISLFSQQSVRAQSLRVHQVSLLQQAGNERKNGVLGNFCAHIRLNWVVWVMRGRLI